MKVQNVICRPTLCQAALFVVISMLVLPNTAAVRAQSETWKTVTLPLRHGLAARFRYPPEWSVKLAGWTPRIEIRDAAGKKATFWVTLSKPTDYWIKHFRASEEETVKRYPGEQEKRTRAPDYTKYNRVFATGQTTLAGQPAHLRETAAASRKPEDGAARARWTALFGGRVVVKATFYTLTPALYRKWRKAATAMAASVQILRADQFKPDEPVVVTYESKRVRLSERRGYYMDARLQFFHERGWKPAVRQFRNAGGRSERGFFVAEFVPPWATPPRHATGRLIVVFSGLRVVPQSRASFLDTAPALIKFWFGEPKELSRKTVTIEGFRFLARSRPRRGESTMLTYVRTYRVKAKDGGELLVKSYTAGGMTVAANILLVGAEPAYQRLLKETEPWVRAARIKLYSSAFRFGPR